MNRLDRRICLAAAACVSLAPVAGGQDSTTGEARDTWSTAVTLGLPGFQSTPVPPQFFTVGLQVTNLRPGQLSGDIAVGTVPFLLGFGGLVMGMRGGLALPMEMSPDAFIVPSSGLSSIVGAGDGGGFGVVGANVGLSLILGSAGKGGIRAGVTWHRFIDEEQPLWLLEIGFLTGKGR